MKKKWKLVLPIVAALLLLFTVALPVSAADVPTAEASRDIASQSISAGGTTEVTVTFTSLLAETKAFALQEDIPSGWTFTRGTDDADSFKESTHEWVWFSVGAGASNTVTYSLTAPTDASGSYSIAGTVTGAEVTNEVTGETTIDIDIGVVPTAEASRDIASQSISAGGTTEVTVTFTSLLAETKAFALQEDIPSGWTFTKGTDDADSFKESTHEWVWFSVGAGASKTVTYSLTAPTDASGSYSIAGTVTAAEVINEVTGETTIEVGVVPTAEASRDIASQSISAGGTTEVTVTFTSLLAETKAFALQEDIPSGWTFTRGTDDADSFKESTHEWVWFSVGAGASKTVTYSLTAPTDASGSYSIAGTVTAAEVINEVAGETTIDIGVVPTAEASRDIASQSIGAGGTTEVTVTFTSLLTEAKAFALKEDIPSGWTFTRGTDDADSFKESTHEWVWFSVGAGGASKTVTYSLTAPTEASGSYSIAGTVTAAEVINEVTGETTIEIIPGIAVIYTLNLQTGWNIISTPIAVDPSIDTWGEFSADLDIDSLAVTYYFNGSSQIWGQVLAGYEVKPCDAIYVKMASEDTAPIIASPNPSVSSKELYAGWNLVSLAYIGDSDSPGMKANEALISVEKVTGDLTGYVQVVSPPVAQPSWIYTGGAIADWNGEGQPPDGWMLTGNGYWVFMLNDGTLAGFSFTPLDR